MAIDGVARVESVPEPLGQQIRFLASVGGQRVVVYTARSASPVWLDHVRLKGLARPPREGLDDWLRAERAVGTLRVDPREMALVTPAPRIVEWASSVRKRFLGFSESALGPGLGALLNGICVNSVREIDKDVTEGLRRTGTIHIVSASGFHVFILGASVIFLLRRLRLSRTAEAFALLGCLTFFALVAGLESPIVRASAMALILRLAFVVRREFDGLTALAASVIGYLIVFPEEIFQIGFQLSVVAVAGLAMAYRRVEVEGIPAFGVLRIRAAEAARMSLAVSVGTAPLLAYHFGRISLVSPVANPLVGFAVSLAMTAGLGLFAVSGLLPSLAGWLMGISVRPALGWLLLVVDRVGALNFAQLEVPAFDAWILVPIYAALAMLWRWRPVPA